MHFFVTLNEKIEQDKKTTNHTIAGVLVFLKKLSLKDYVFYYVFFLLAFS